MNEKIRQNAISVFPGDKMLMIGHVVLFSVYYPYHCDFF